MPRRSVLSTAERSSLLAIPEADDELIRQYTFSAADLALIGQRRGDANRLGMAVQMALLRFPGQGLLPEAIVPAAMLRYIGHQCKRPVITILTTSVVPSQHMSAAGFQRWGSRSSTRLAG